ncbi:MAG: hypothetical protein CME68_11250 [Halobacteriovoraceae bacterium]|nr:hypothetical protein [Halobacteriovoraceae bacterium]|tara:strand:+ start:2113 stop:2442 length:330 start_codon:yes stop_codon:yes gene_type:complete
MNLNFEIKIIFGNDFDCLNKILNIFCGKGFTLESLTTQMQYKNNKNELKMKVKGPQKLLIILLKRMDTFPDVFNISWNKAPAFIFNEGLQSPLTKKINQRKGERNEALL